MAVKRRRVVRTTPYPIGTRIAEGYGMDLDAEAARGLPGEHLGRRPRPVEEAADSVLLRPEFLVLVAGPIVLFLALTVASLFVRPGSHPAGPSRPLEAEYPDRRSAIRAGAVERGEIPHFLPDGATDIHERHDSGTGESWVAFRFTPAEGRGMTERLWRLPPGRSAGVVVRGPGTAWWPLTLRGRFSDRELSSAWELYETQRRAVHSPDVEYLAVDWTSRRACLWRESPGHP